jgi:hypothetical protein
VVVEVLEPFTPPCTPMLVPGMVAFTLRLPPTVLVTVREVGTRALLEFLELPKPQDLASVDALKDGILFVMFQVDSSGRF